MNDTKEMVIGKVDYETLTPSQKAWYAAMVRMLEAMVISMCEANREKKSA